MKRIFLTSALVVFCTAFAHAQTADADDNQSWNDLQITIPINEQFDFTLTGTLRFGKNITRLNDRRIAVGFVYKPSKVKSWFFQPFYLNIAARNANGRFLTEHRLNFRAIYRFPFKRFGLSHRSWFERRLRQPRNSWRYRPSLTVEKDIGKVISGTRIFATEEIFYDSILKRFSRNRFSVGVSKTLTADLSFDIFYLRQNDGFSRPGDLNVIGANFKIRL